MLASGFTDAPVCRALLFSIIISSIVVSITDTRHLFYFTVVPHVWQYNQYWRLLVWQTCYTSSTELLFAAVSIYSLRIIERLWGSRKFAVCVAAIDHAPKCLGAFLHEAMTLLFADRVIMQSFILSVLPPTLLFPPLILALLLRPLSFNRLNTLPTVPTPLVFALLAQYHATIPHIRKYHIVPSFSTHGISDGVTLSDKSVNYLLACQLAFSSIP